MKRSLSILLFLLFFTNVNAQVIKNKQNNQFKSQIDLLMETFKNKKTNKLVAILSQGYTINRIPKGLESQALAQIVEQMPAFTQYVVTEVKSEKGNQRVFVSFILKDEKLDANLLFDKQKKIKELNLLEGADID